jgi:hypothetical protein
MVGPRRGDGFARERLGETAREKWERAVIVPLAPPYRSRDVPRQGLKVWCAAPIR